MTVFLSRLDQYESTRVLVMIITKFDKFDVTV
jgi:hypothetical protein